MNNTAENLYSSHFLDADESIRTLEKKYAKKLVVNPDFDRKIVSFQANKSEPIFRWFHYREGFSKQLVEYVLDSLDISGNGLLVDPFAGTGAAPFVAARYKNMKGIAFELMPVGAFFMECRNAFAKLDAKKLVTFSESVLSARNQWIKIKPDWEFKHLNITKDAFSPDCEYELRQYKTWASKQKAPDYKLFLDFVAFSILESFSYTRKDGQYLRWDYRSPRFSGSKNATTFDKGVIYTFHDALRDKLKRIISDLTDKSDLFDTEPCISSETIKVIQGSVLENILSLQDESVDLVITSPPYCNRYDYTRTYALELAYLGVDEDAIKKLRQTLLTCTVENKPKEFKWLDLNIKKSVDKAFNKQACLLKIISFLKNEVDNGVLNNKGIKTMVEGYFYDSTVHLAQMSKKLKSGAYYVMVNDNVQYNGLEVPVDLLLCEIASCFGLRTEKIWVLPKGKGNSSQQMKKHGRSELRKCVYVWKKL